MKLPNISIRTSLTAVVAVLGLLVFFLAGSAAWKAYEHRETAVHAHELTRTDELLLHAQGNLAAERGATNGALNAAAIVTAKARATIDARRAKANGEFKKGVARIRTGSDFPGKAKRLRAAMEAFAEVEALRRRVDAELAKTGDQRDPAVKNRWVPTISRLVLASEKLRVAAQVETGRMNVALKAHMDLKHYIWIMSEFAGRERAILAGTIASGGRIAPNRLAVLSNYRGHVQTAWESVTNIASKGHLGRAELQQIEQLRRDFFGKFEQTRQSVYKAGIAGAAYPMTAQVWLTRSTAAINGVLKFSDLVNEKTGEIAGSLAGSATTELIFDLVILLFSFAVASTAAWIVLRRVTQPLMTITDRLSGLAAGNDAFEIEGAERKDEIGAMWRALEELKGAVGEAFRLRQMVQQMPINVMMCDTKNFEINYLNTLSLETLRKLEQHLPIKADEMIGQSIDIFHKAPEHQRRLLADPRNLPHSAVIDVGGEKLDLLVTGINDKDGNYVGPMLTWSVVTEKVRVAERVGEVVSVVSSASTEMQSTAQTMSSGAEETARQTQAVSAASEEATTNVQTVAAAAEEMSNSIAEISRQVTQSTEIATRAVAEAEKTNTTVEGLSEAAQKVGEVVRLISDIAEKTNLLALNATIEAARAGEAGKGFAVVANEVKSLAEQTAKATDEIASQITAIQTETTGAVEAIGGIGTTIEQINEITTTISAAVEEQSAATQEIARNCQEAAKGTQEVSSNIMGVNQAADETGKSAQQVLAAAGELATQGEALQVEIDRFVGKEAA